MNVVEKVKKKVFNKTYRQLIEEGQEIIEDPLLKAVIAGQEIDREKALTIPSVSSAVGLICDSFAMIPFRLYKKRRKKTDIRSR